MSRKYFGTDGIRGRVGDAPITPDFVLRLGFAAGEVLARQRSGHERPAVLIGKDTRVSGYMLEAALRRARRGDVMPRPMPTPAVALRARCLSADRDQPSPINTPTTHPVLRPTAGAADAVEHEIEAALERRSRAGRRPNSAKRGASTMRRAPPVLQSRPNALD
jgi:phosphoglucosamine mutase